MNTFPMLGRLNVYRLSVKWRLGIAIAGKKEIKMIKGVESGESETKLT